MVNFTAVFILVSSLAAFASPLGKSTIPEVEKAISQIAVGLNDLQGDLDKFPLTGATATQAVGIHTKATSITLSLNVCTSAVTTVGVVSVSDGRAIIQSVQLLVPAITNALATIVKKKAGFLIFPIGLGIAVVEADLKHMHDSAVALGNALVSAAPTVLKAEANEIRATIDHEFIVAISAYASG